MRSSTHALTASGLARPTRTSALLVLGALLLAGIVATPLATATPLAEKQAQAAALDREVASLEDDYADLQERFRGAQVDLKRTQKKVTRTQAKLRRSRAELDASKERLEDRALAVYRDGAGSTQLLEIARAGSFSDFFDKLETIDRVGSNDAKILNRVRTLTQRVQDQEQQLRSARDRKAKLVRRINTSRKKMQRLIADRQAALGSVSAEIRTLMEQNRAREAAALADEGRQRAAVIRSGGTPDDSTSAAANASGTASADGAATGGGAENGGGSGGGSASSTSSSSLSVPLPPPSGSASSAAGIAMGKVGAPYVYGAAGPDSFDCSGLVVWAFAQAGRGGLPHSTYSLIGMGVSVPYDQAQVGDLVFTNNSGHMGIYVGGGSFVHAPRTGRNVTVESLGNYSIVAIRRI